MPHRKVGRGRKGGKIEAETWLKSAFAKKSYGSRLGDAIYSGKHVF